MLPLYQKAGAIRFACSSNWTASTAMSLRIRTPSGVGSPHLEPEFGGIRGPATVSRSTHWPGWYSDPNSWAIKYAASLGSGCPAAASTALSRAWPSSIRRGRFSGSPATASLSGRRCHRYGIRNIQGYRTILLIVPQSLESLADPATKGLFRDRTRAGLGEQHHRAPGRPDPGGRGGADLRRADLLRHE